MVLLFLKNLRQHLLDSLRATENGSRRRAPYGHEIRSSKRRSAKVKFEKVKGMKTPSGVYLGRMYVERERVSETYDCDVMLSDVM